jgi:cell division protein FtsA
MKTLFAHGVAPQMRPLPPKRTVELSVLDVGTSKIVCLIARLRPLDRDETAAGRTHKIEVLGIGHHRSRGVKAGAIVDMEAAEQSIRHAVDAAERMADLRVDQVIVSVGAGRLGSDAYAASVSVAGHPVGQGDIQRVLRSASAYCVRDNRTVLHSLPIGYGLDATRHIRDPRGMVGEQLGVDMHVISADTAPLRNLVLCVERCHLEVAGIVASPYASGLACLAEEETELGVTLIDLGGGTTTVALFRGGHCVHTDGVALGGHHITMDIARGLSTRLDHAERLKTLHASVFPGLKDDLDMIAVPAVGEDDGDLPYHVPKSQLVRVVRPRVEEILELVRDRLKASGFVAEAGRRVVLTGGASQLTGLVELAGRMLGPQVRIGRSLGVRGLPEAARGPSFAAALGLLTYPQTVGLEHFEPRRTGALTGTDGYIARVGQWLKESF